MGRGQLGAAVRDFEHLVDGRSVAGMTEWQLLRRYLDRRDEVAFTAIVERHAPMVLGVCRRILTDRRDVEDAFQATFLILARKGGTLREGDPVGHWLYGVARRVALRVRTAAWRRRSRERPGEAPEVAITDDDPSARELVAVVDEELARLPAKYRMPVVLCYLEGLTHDEAALRLGWPVGSVKGRLARARDLLKPRLARRGFAPAGEAVALLGGLPSVPPALLAFTIRAAMAGPASGVVPAGVASLVAGSLTSMMLNKLKVLAVLLLSLGTGAAVMAYQYQAIRGDGDAPNPGKKAATPATDTSDVEDWEARWPSLTEFQDDQDPKSKAILAKLNDRIAMSFPNETPFEDVKKYIEQSTQDDAKGLPNGIPIYVDPQGLIDSDKLITSPVSINLEGIPLKTTLRLVLKQMAMTYHVQEGILIIVSEDSETQTTLGVLEIKSRNCELTRQQYKQLIEMLKLRAEVDKLIHPPQTGKGFQ